MGKVSNIKPLVAGNWKMNGMGQSADEIKQLQSIYDNPSENPQCEILICPPATLIMPYAHLTMDHSIQIGGQDCHANKSGAHTGDLSAEMIKDCGADYVIVGHSERRMDHGERDVDVRAKAGAGWRAGLKVILCIGELIGERKSNLTLKVIERQLTNSVPEGATAENLVIAYEPVWAIGTGLTPTVADVAEVHTFIREKLVSALGAEQGNTMRILYGGSVKPDNAKELMAAANVNGALVGGASLKASDFSAIINAYR